MPLDGVFLIQYWSRSPGPSWWLALLEKAARNSCVAIGECIAVPQCSLVRADLAMSFPRGSSAAKAPGHGGNTGSIPVSMNSQIRCSIVRRRHLQQCAKIPQGYRLLAEVASQNGTGGGQVIGLRSCADIRHQDQVRR
jgi:hypothetical protein